MKFVKAHACGNDFLVVEEPVSGWFHPDVARRVCARNTGVGADGVEFLDRREEGSMFLRLFNADGSEAELSGNGTRCVAAWLAMSEGLEEAALGTHGGMRRSRVVGREGALFQIETGMGVPRVFERPVMLADVGLVAGCMVNVGNPHYVIFPEREDFGAHGMSWQELGAKISTSELFPHGTNVEFVRVKGCGPTASSGTGTCASAAAAMTLREATRTLKVVAEGGAQSVVWRDARAEMLLTGPAEIVCQGEVF